ncbi:YqcC family protein [Vibrio sp. S9_S30]|uniref:YqcC family protein n=1 Tax=Vibrio sp. S9_S30 TaxID=2720226 RepID=UPI001681B9A8|nr:YqcC family protein [Vibrio sp. S9_S30]MBD1555955.1 YqcC family protein [Vibrio sp. S9_S30]
MNTARISILIENLKSALQQENLWDSMPPSTETLASQQPFAYDTLEPQQWLQWVFVTRFEAMIASNQPLPSTVQLLPYFEEVWKEDASKIKVLTVISDIDEAFASC